MADIKYLKQKIIQDEAAKAAKELELDQKQQALKKLMNNPGPSSTAGMFDKPLVAKSVTEKINTKEVIPQIAESAYVAKQKALLAASEAARQARRQGLDTAGDALKQGLKQAKTGLKGIPILGSAIGIGSALMGSQDASAAIPVLDAADSTGPQVGSQDHAIESGQMQGEDIRKLMEQQAKLMALQHLRQGK